MEANFQAIKNLYQEEIDAYKRQIEELKSKNKSSDEKNAGLLEKVHELQDLIEKANVANQDLNTAFEHVREENMKLQLHSNNQESNTFRSENNELALETVQRQYINLARESVSWISEKDKLVQRVKFLERECDRYTRDNSTLGKQVRHLLKTLEEERGMIIRRVGQLDDSIREPQNAADIIDKHLVTFESIEQMQHQNQKLLSLVKELSKKEEERETRVENDDIRRLNEELASLKLQLDGVKNDRERIMTAFNTILKERDLFKILLCKTRQVEHLTPEIFQKMVTIACSAGPALTNEPENTQDRDAHIVDLKAMISKLEHELADLREESQDTRNKNEHEIKLKTELLEQAHMKIMSESQQSETLKERIDVLETNIKSLTSEYDEVRTKSQKLIFEMEQLTKDKKDLAALLEEEKQRRQSEISIMLTQIQERAHVSELKEMISNLDNEFAEFRDDFKNARAESDDKLRAKFAKEIVDLRSEFENARNRLEHEIQLKTELLEQAHMKVFDESQQSTAFKERNDALEVNIRALTEECNTIKTKLELHHCGCCSRRQPQPSVQPPTPLPQPQAQPQPQQLTFQPKFNEFKSKITSLQSEITELQRLRKIERHARLKLAKKVHLLQDSPKALATYAPQEEDDKSSKPPERIVLKRRRLG